jgi:hypothetical protein
MKYPRFYLETIPKSRKIIRFTIWDTETDEIAEVEEIKLDTEEMVVSVMNEWKGKVDAFNAQG